jgi:hypothetical protein
MQLIQGVVSQFEIKGLFAVAGATTPGLSPGQACPELNNGSARATEGTRADLLLSN